VLAASSNCQSHVLFCCILTRLLPLVVRTMLLLHTLAKLTVSTRGSPDQQPGDNTQAESRFRGLAYQDPAGNLHTVRRVRYTCWSITHLALHLQLPGHHATGYGDHPRACHSMHACTTEPLHTLPHAAACIAGCTHAPIVTHDCAAQPPIVTTAAAIVIRSLWARNS
jgi:hypothetical protein